MGLKLRSQKELQHFFGAGSRACGRRLGALWSGLMMLVILQFTGCAKQLEPNSALVRDSLAELLRERFSVREAASLADGFEMGGDRYQASVWLGPFYRQRGFRLAWSSANGPLGRAADLIEILRQAPADGLATSDFRLEQIERTMGRCKRRGHGDFSECLVDLDLLLSDGFFRFAGALHRGRVLPAQIYSSWQVKEPKVNLSSLLETAIDLNRVAPTLEAMRPTLAGYSRLRSALKEYLELVESGGWSRPRSAPSDPGHGYRTDVLNQLRMTGDLDADTQTDSPSQDLYRGLSRFQRRHGLPSTGLLDEDTAAALAVPLAERVEQLRLNLERWRWLPHREGSRYVLVRISDYELDVVEDGAVVMNMRVIVGKPFWRTPIFSSQMTSLVLNPRWYVPTSIAVGEILPMARRDSTYLSARDMLLLSGSGEAASVVSPAAVDWTEISFDRLEFRFVQLPGPTNPLGRVKFHFDNPFGVFLHDTPQGEMFARERRDFSHGCIRLENSLELAAYALSDRPGWTASELLEKLSAGQSRHVRLATALSVYVMSWTAWVDDEGELNFRDDENGDDARLRGLMLRSRRF